MPFLVSLTKCYGSAKSRVWKSATTYFGHTGPRASFRRACTPRAAFTEAPSSRRLVVRNRHRKKRGTICSVAMIDLPFSSDFNTPWLRNEAPRQRLYARRLAPSSYSRLVALFTMNPIQSRAPALLVRPCTPHHQTRNVHIALIQYVKPRMRYY